MTAALSIRDLSKVYANNVHALRGISLDVQEGDFFALLGPNGAGKSTTIGCVSGLVPPTSGSVRVQGHDIVAEPKAAKVKLGNRKAFNAMVASFRLTLQGIGAEHDMDDASNCFEYLLQNPGKVQDLFED